MSKSVSPYRYQTCPITFGFTGKGMLQPIYCGQWNCDRCRKKLARDWAIRARSQINKDSDHTYRFWTLTMHPRITSKDFAYAIIPKLWSTFRKHVERSIDKLATNSERWQYLAFIEGQPKRNNMPHFHILSSVPFPGRLKDFCATHGWGYQAKDKPIDGYEAADYVAKYASKGDSGMPPKLRRCRPSRGWQKLPKERKAKLVVPLRTETTGQFLYRVHVVLGIPLLVITIKWSDATTHQED